MAEALEGRYRAGSTTPVHPALCGDLDTALRFLPSSTTDCCGFVKSYNLVVY